MVFIVINSCVLDLDHKMLYSEMNRNLMMYISFSKRSFFLNYFSVNKCMVREFFCKWPRF